MLVTTVMFSILSSFSENYIGTGLHQATHYFLLKHFRARQHSYSAFAVVPQVKNSMQLTDRISNKNAAETPMVSYLAC